MDSDFNLVASDAKGAGATAAVKADPSGLELPWHPKPVSDLEFGPAYLQEVPTLLAFCETNSLEEQRAIEAALTSVSRGFVEKQKVGACFYDLLLSN